MPSPSRSRRRTLRYALLFGSLLGLFVVALLAAPGSRARDAEPGGVVLTAQAGHDINAGDARVRA